MSQKALFEGQRAGQLGVGYGANPHELGTEAYAEWERGRRSAEARSRVIRCRYADRACDCGGRGFCLDVA